MGRSGRRGQIEKPTGLRGAFTGRRAARVFTFRASQTRRRSRTSLGNRAHMRIPSVQDCREALQQGADILAPVLTPHGFHFRIVSSGTGSGGAFAHGEFVRGDRRLELHFRYSLGLVTYHVGALSPAHGDYVRALLGRSSAGHYPGTPAEPLAGFELLREDLVEHCFDFVSGTGELFRVCVERHKAYERLSPLQKMDYGTA